MTKKETKYKSIGTRKKVGGKDRHKRMEDAYFDWKGGIKKGKGGYTLKDIAKKHKLHISDISNYITEQMKNKKTETE